LCPKSDRALIALYVIVGNNSINPGNYQQTLFLIADNVYVGMVKVISIPLK